MGVRGRELRQLVELKAMNQIVGALESKLEEGPV